MKKPCFSKTTIEIIGVFEKKVSQKSFFNTLLAYISNWVRVLTAHSLGSLDHTWSLSVEEQFYFFWPVILSLLLHRSKSHRKIIAVATVIAVLSWIDGMIVTKIALKHHEPLNHLFYSLDTKVVTLMIGCILAVVLSSGMVTPQVMKRAQKLLPIIAPASFVYLVCFAVWSDVFTPTWYYYGFVLVALFTAVLIFDVLTNPGSLVRKFFGMKWLVWIGSVSYGIYIWHWPVFQLMLSSGLMGWSALLPGLALTLVFVLLSYHLLEQPLLQLKRHFTPSIREQKTPSTNSSITV